MPLPTKDAVLRDLERRVAALEAGGGGPATVADGDYGDVDVSGSGAVWTVEALAGIETTLAAIPSSYQAVSAILTALAALSNTTGLIRQTGASSFSRVEASSDGDVLRRAAGVVGFGSIPSASVTGLGSLATLSAIGSAQVTDGSLTYADLQDVTARSVVGRSAATDGVSGAITAGSDGDVLRRAAGLVGFGSIPVASVTGLATVATSGSAADLSSGTLPAARMPALTGDVTTVAGAVATTIGTAKVTSAMLRDSAAVSVMGRSANSVGVPGDIAAVADGDVLRRAGGAVGFGAVPVASITGGVATTRTLSTTAPIAGGGDLSADRTISLNDAGVTYAKLQDVAATSVVGRAAGTSGVSAAISASANGDVLCMAGGALGFGAVPEASVTGLVADLAVRPTMGQVVAATMGLNRR